MTKNTGKKTAGQLTLEQARNEFVRKATDPQTAARQWQAFMSVVDGTAEESMFGVGDSPNHKAEQFCADILQVAQALRAKEYSDLRIGFIEKLHAPIIAELEKAGGILPKGASGQVAYNKGVRQKVSAHRPSYMRAQLMLALYDNPIKAKTLVLIRKYERHYCLDTLHQTIDETLLKMMFKPEMDYENLHNVIAATISNIGKDVAKKLKNGTGDPLQRETCDIQPSDPIPSEDTPTMEVIALCERVVVRCLKELLPLSKSAPMIMAVDNVLDSKKKYNVGYASIAHTLEIPLDTVKSRIFYAKEKLEQDPVILSALYHMTGDQTQKSAITKKLGELGHELLGVEELQVYLGHAERGGVVASRRGGAVRGG